MKYLILLSSWTLLLSAKGTAQTVLPGNYSSLDSIKNVTTFSQTVSLGAEFAGDVIGVYSKSTHGVGILGTKRRF